MDQPIACTLGVTCFVQNYVDDDPGPAAEDFTCGPLTYNGHKGTDFALPSLTAMHAGVAVLASAPGVVLATRDGMADIAADAPNAPDIKGRECGNGVLLDNGGGWTTQYCHMKRGSLVVTKGERLAHGAHLGEVGLSGDTVFPHVHITVRHDGKVVDPFAPGTAQPPVCGAAPGPGLWQPPIAYVPGGLISIGIASRMPDFAALKAGLDTPAALLPDAPALVVWAYAFGGRAGDRISMRLVGPGGQVAAQEVTLDRAQAQLFRATGRRLPASGWPTGTYAAEVQMIRGGKVLGHKEVAVKVAP